MKKRKWVALGVMLAMSLGVLAGCSSTSGSAETSGGSTEKVNGTTDTEAPNTAASNTDGGLSEITVGINAEVSDLSPFSAASNGRNSVLLTLYQPLGDLKGVGGDLEGILMKSYNAVDVHTYDIEIYDYIYDTAGNHITSSDVVWSFNKAIEMATNTNTKFVESIEATGDYSVRLVLNSDFIGGFANVVKAVYIVSQSAYEASPDEMAATPIGTTQYKVTEFVPGSTATFEKTNNYWQTDKNRLSMYSTANIDKITYKTIKEASQMSVALETGVIDMGISMDATEAKRFMEGGESAKGFTVFDKVTNIGNQMYLSGNPNGPFYSSKELRQAVCYAIDKQGLIKGVLDGFGIPEYTFGGEMFSDFNPAWKDQDYYNFNVDKAKELLAQSGFNASQSSIRIMTDNSTMRNKVAQIIQAYLMQIGIKSEILQYDSALFNSYKSDPTQWDIMLDNTGSSDYLVTIWRGKFDARSYSSGTTNGWVDEKLQSLLLTALNEDTHTAENMDAFHQYFKEQAYGLGLFNNTVFTAATDNVESIVYDPKMFVYVPGTVLK